MNEELRRALLAAINSAEPFVGEQAVVTELLRWELKYNIAWLPLHALIGYAGYRGFRLVLSMATDKAGDSWVAERGNVSPVGSLALMALVVFTAISLICAIGSAENILQIWLAPKVYLIEYAANLAK